MSNNAPCTAQPHSCSGHCLDETFQYSEDGVDYFQVETDMRLTNSPHAPYILACLTHVLYKYPGKVVSLYIDEEGVVTFGVR
jgi:hypothetical protein